LEQSSTFRSRSSFPSAQFERICERRQRRWLRIVLGAALFVGVGIGFTGMALDAAHARATQRQLKAELADVNDRLQQIVPFASGCVRTEDICHYCPCSD
jgi:hypothetical protein